MKRRALSIVHLVAAGDNVRKGRKWCKTPRRVWLIAGASGWGQSVRNVVAHGKKPAGSAASGAAGFLVFRV